jgi:hypothetical protein
MSRSTLLIGTIYFKDDVPLQKQYDLKADLEAICEDEFKFQDPGEFRIDSLKYSSHVEADKITAFFKKHKNCFKEYHLDLFYLEEADESWNSD